MVDRTRARSNQNLSGQANPFIVTTSHEKPSSASRRLIRSHVMRGKNVKKPASSHLKPGAWMNRDSGAEEDLEAAEEKSMVPNPRLEFAGSGLAFFRFADGVQPYMADMIFKFFTILKQSLYPIEVCLAWDPESSKWFEYLQSDAMYLHSMVWSTQLYFDWLQGSGPSHSTLVHFSKTLNLLQGRVVDPDMATSDTTISVVVTLVMMTALVGKQEEAKRHMKGLHRMVVVRGGLRELRENSQLQIKCCRADLSIALANGTKPFFFSKNIAWEPFLPTKEDHIVPLTDMDTRLANIWGDLRTFCRSANIAFQTGQKVDPELFQETLISIEYRLIHLDPNEDFLQETLRLATLAFSTTVFLQTVGVKARYDSLSRQSRSSIHLESFEQAPHDLCIWILFVAAVFAVTGEDDYWVIPLLQERLRRVEVETWNTVRGILKKFLWIDALHDAEGERIFDRVCRQGSEAVGLVESCDIISRKRMENKNE
ncbi:uncharacterized protein PAC_02705 [Phialocephala subalpina]|uniref:Uncharacterized protein n=1 Tax=Phialocephala subalpina TaxID=576137 RepID=A0A1L7WJA5_9HELO|nr:uncharacterized protein PAC_02705 [Phialocephala subalpina]